LDWRAAEIIPFQAELKPSRLSSVECSWGRKQISAMRNPVDIGRTHSRAIILEIGERLRTSLREERELPASLTTRIDRLRELGAQDSPSIVPDRGEQQRSFWWKR